MKTNIGRLRLLFAIIAILDQFRTGVAQEEQVILNDSIYAIFNTTDRIHWLTAQANCMGWGGNLITIDSKQIDSLLFYLTTSYTCWIGLNDRDNEANHNVSAFVWVDGSTSTYRQFDTIANANGEPDDSNGARDCVGFRYGQDLGSDGWDDRKCDAFVDCYFCQKSGDSRGCDLIYGGSCYRAFEVSGGINWLDAQSSCAVWGGDLTSITTERVNNLLYTAISETVSNCWIGLYERDGDGMYQWIDGTVLSYTNWTGSAPTATNDNDCVQMNTNGAGSWIATDCEGTSNRFICKKPSTIADTTVGRFGELINGRKNFQELNGNTFFYNSSLTLACGGEENSNVIQWKYSQQSDLSSSQTLTPSYASTVTGLSWITVNNSQQGYYRCEINSSLSYTIGLYDLSLTTVAVSGSTYTYIVGVDREDVLLLCDPMDSSVVLSLLRWEVENGPSFSNPVNINGLKDSLSNQSTTKINCNSGGTLLASIFINIIDYTNIPQISTSMGTVQNESTIVLMNEFITVSCSVSTPADGVQWYYRSYIDDEVINITSLSTFSIQTGVSSINVSSEQPGYYSCVINTSTLYTISIPDTASIVEITNFDSPSQQVNYTAGSTNSMLYYSLANIPDSSLRWTTDTVANGTYTQYSIEYPNPVLLSRVFSDVGAGVHTFSCFYRMSPVTLVGSLQLVIRDTATISISYAEYDNTFNDATNPNFPSPQQIAILEGTKDITFSCNLIECEWNIRLQNFESETSKLLYVIPMITKSHEGNYSLLRTTNLGKRYTTANVQISVVPKSINSASDSLTIIIIAISITVVFLLVSLAVILIIICVVIVYRRKVTQFPRQSLCNKIDTSPKEYTKTTEVNNSIELNTCGYSMLDEVETVENKLTEPDSLAVHYENILQANDSTLHQEPLDELSTVYHEISEVVNQQMIPIPLDLYKTHINKLWQKEGSLQEEYESLGGKTHKYSCTIASAEKNRNKNRFRLIYPYDKSRVLLKDSGDGNSDYINASHIPGNYTTENFIASQAPKENTIQEFWQMITENKIVNVAMVTNLVESGRKKCDEYFPLKIGGKIIIRPYEITLETEEIRTGYTIRMMSVQYNGRTVRVKHFHFTAWPDHDVPILYDELLLFVSKVQEGLIKTKAPILVHCSAGVGRTGTFITLYNLLAAIQQSKPISIYNVVHEMREHRPQMVQTFAQYKFIYLSVLEMLLGNTSIPTAEFMDTFNLYMQSENEGYVSVFFQQYSELNYQCEKGFDHVCNDALEDSNSNKNLIKDILPCDNNRVELASQHWQGNYINATSIDNGEFIITVHPTHETLRDFHQLIYQMEPSLIVMLCTKRELQLMEQNKSKRVVYWQSYADSIEEYPFVLTCENTDKSAFIRNKVSMNHRIDGCNRTFTQIIVNHWSNKGDPDLKKSVVLLKTILEFKQHYPTSPIIIHCVDGAGKSGVIYTVYRGIVDSTEKGYIDIFHIVKKLRKERMKSVTNLNYFVACYTLMNEYCFKMQCNI